jgi:hypothetical protein
MGYVMLGCCCMQRGAARRGAARLLVHPASVRLAKTLCSQAQRGWAGLALECRWGQPGGMQLRQRTFVLADELTSKRARQCTARLQGTQH